MERYRQQETSRKQRSEFEARQAQEREIQQLRAQLKTAQVLNATLQADKEAADNEAKKLRFRIFVLEGDLKTLLRKFEFDNVRPDMRNAFRLKEFRALFDHLQGLLARMND